MVFDTSAEVFGYGAALVFIVGLVVMVLGTKKGNVMGLTPKGAGALRIIGVIVMLVAVATMAGITFTSETADVSGYKLDVSATEDSAQAYLAEDNGDHKITWNVHFNYTGDGAFLNSTNTATVNFTLTRLDQSSKDHVVKTYVSDKGSVVDEATGNTYYLVNKGQDWNIDWTKAGTTENSVVASTGDANTLKLESGGSAWTTLTIVLRADAIDAMPLYEAEFFYIDFGGETWTVAVSVINWAGTPPTS